ncbi:MAG: hypothetical protein A2010_13345 [Nitrospirae bacterium GWD2_57_9]|nr:MAG: hypothetical protein A2010_13345 [Nitrospirae bacterium GWD2_57_9]
MNIEIDANEYRDLLDIAHLADVVLSGHRQGGDKRSERHRALIQKLYSLAKDAGLGPMMSFNENNQTYVPTPDFEKSTLAHMVLNEFGEHLFWDHLINRLVQRDAAMMLGGMEKPGAMNEDERHRLFHAIRERYAAEFAANDIVNLQVIEPLGAGGGVPLKTSD